MRAQISIGFGSPFLLFTINFIPFFQVPLAAGQIVVSPSSAASIFVSILVIMIFMGVGLAYYIHRNR